MSGEAGANSVWITSQEAAAIINRHHETVLLYCKRGLIAAKKLGGKWQVHRPSLEAPPGADAPVAKSRRGRPRKVA